MEQNVEIVSTLESVLSAKGAKWNKTTKYLLIVTSTIRTQKKNKQKKPHTHTKKKKKTKTNKQTKPPTNQPKNQKHHAQRNTWLLQ